MMGYDFTDPEHLLIWNYWATPPYAVAVVAKVNVFGDWGDWAAYIGGNSWDKEENCVQFVKEHGDKLPVVLADAHFPDLENVVKHHLGREIKLYWRP